ncbi:branched-chain amino acid ABC transporter ATP-binding protein/permease [Oligoflexus tunisiensis]|uniref:branched-chain amino acid ABC transporter ATP-binding protein/permease n=1 Tax=Oligoflexus tunisiensis TaxID=708132 RepID=UPI000A5BCB34|nr:branched-chain amino acid ABC transporter ATP-binding protein/permease [Oligoflexus tunisiensis]
MPELDAFIIIVMLQQALLAISLYVPLMSGQLSLASPAFYAIGGYLAALISTKYFTATDDSLYPLTWVLGEMLLAGLLCFAIAQAIGRMVLRLRGIYLALATLALVEVVRVTCLNLEWTGGAIGIFAIPQVFAEQQGYLWLFLPLFLLILYGVRTMERSRIGEAFRALREDEYAAAAMGIDPARCKTLAFAWGAAIAGITGAASAHLLNTWNARQGTFDASINILAYVVIGGPWSVWGAALGGAVLSALPEILRPLQDYRLVVNGTLIVLASLYLPRGLIPDRRRKHPRPTSWPTLREAPVSGDELILQIEGLDVQFGGLKAVHGLSLAIKRGEIFGLIGPNGAGKTTVFNALTGFAPVTSGSIRFLGQDITRASVHHRARMGLMRTFQNLRLLRQQTVLQNILAATHRFDAKQRRALFPAGAEAEAWAWMEFVGLLEQAGRCAGDLNYGDQRRLELARALMSRPEVLLMDEPVAGMNPSEKAGMQALIRQIRDRFGITVILIEHHVPLVLGICDRIAVLNFGETIALGEPAAIQNDPEVRRAYLGSEEALA